LKCVGECADHLNGLRHDGPMKSSSRDALDGRWTSRAWPAPTSFIVFPPVGAGHARDNFLGNLKNVGVSWRAMRNKLLPNRFSYGLLRRSTPRKGPRSFQGTCRTQSGFGRTVLVLVLLIDT
jgi:hypothetical protein